MKYNSHATFPTTIHTKKKIKKDVSSISKDIIYEKKKKIENTTYEIDMSWKRISNKNFVIATFETF